MMTALIWLLIANGGGHFQPTTIERFATAADCKAAADLTKNIGYGGIGCYPMKVLKP